MAAADVPIGWQQLERIQDYNFINALPNREYHYQHIHTHADYAVRVSNIARTSQPVATELAALQLIAQHPHVRSLVEVVNNFYATYRAVVLEWTPRGTLRDFLLLPQHGAFPLSVVRELFAQIVDGVESAHQRGVVLCNLGLHSVHLSDGFLVKVANFRNALLIEGSTPTPQQARPDVVACGEILFALVFQVPPYESASEHDVLYSALQHGRFDFFWQCHIDAYCSRQPRDFAASHVFWQSVAATRDLIMRMLLGQVSMTQVAQDAFVQHVPLPYAPSAEYIRHLQVRWPGVQEALAHVYQLPHDQCVNKSAGGDHCDSRDGDATVALPLAPVFTSSAHPHFAFTTVAADAVLAVQERLLQTTGACATVCGDNAFRINASVNAAQFVVQVHRADEDVVELQVDERPSVFVVEFKFVDGDRVEFAQTYRWLQGQLTGNAHAAECVERHFSAVSESAVECAAE